MEKYGNRSSVPEDSMGESSGKSTESNVFTTNRIKEAQIDELVENLYYLTRDHEIGFVAKCVNYIHQWVDANINFDALDKKESFFEGFYVGGRYIQKLYKKE